MIPPKQQTEDHEINSNDFNYIDYELMIGGLVKEPNMHHPG
jgi:hypothetical protein